MTTLYTQHKTFLRDYDYYIYSAIYDVQNHIHALKGLTISIPELREALISDYHWCDEVLVEALARHGWTMATFLQLLEMSVDGCRSLKTIPTSRRFRKDFERLNRMSDDLLGYRNVLIFAMAKAYYRIDFDEVDDTEIMANIKYDYRWTRLIYFKYVSNRISNLRISI